MKEMYKIYGISDCPACLRACAHLMESYPEKEYVFINCDFSPTFRENIKEKYQFFSFPIVVKINTAGEHLIGGFRELSRLAETSQIKYTPPPIRDPT